MGATLSATVWYLYMARTHMQILVHAFDTCRVTTRGNFKHEGAVRHIYLGLE